MGFKIKEVRKSLKMSQEELAEKSGISGALSLRWKPVLSE